jgi:hypothetical protein
MTTKQYKKAKRKFFKRRVHDWTLYLDGKRILTYRDGLFFPFEPTLYVPMLIKLSDTDAFWHAHFISISCPGYEMKINTYYNNTTTVTFTFDAKQPSRGEPK